MRSIPLRDSVPSTRQEFVLAIAAKTLTLKAAAPAGKKRSTKAVTAVRAQPNQVDAKPLADTKLVAKAAAISSAPDTITLKHLAVALSERYDLSTKAADTPLAEVFEAIVGHLKSGDRVKVGGLGIIEVKNRPGRAGRNPATGKAIQIAASRKIAFRASKELKDAI